MRDAADHADAPAVADLATLVRRASSEGDTYLTPEGTRVVRAWIEGRPVLFCIRNPADRIQRKHSRGRFYEPDELALIKAHFPRGGVFCDVGANIGNHSLYALLYLGAAQAIVFEPNPGAYELLIANLALNRVADRVDLSHLGYGLSDRDQTGLQLQLHDNNLGATRLVAGAGEGGIAVRTGDAMLAGRRVDFIKIDVEGMEMAALRGLEATIAACHPAIFLELEHDNRTDFLAWIEAQGYRLAHEGRRFQHNQNLLILPQ